MKAIEAKITEQSHNNQAHSKQKGAAKGSLEQAALFAEFSRILDKIAVQLANHSELPNIECAKAVTKPKVKAEKVKNVEQKPKEELSAKEIEPEEAENLKTPKKAAKNVKKAGDDDKEQVEEDMPVKEAETVIEEVLSSEELTEEELIEEELLEEELAEEALILEAEITETSDPEAKAEAPLQEVIQAEKPASELKQVVNEEGQQGFEEAFVSKENPSAKINQHLRGEQAKSVKSEQPELEGQNLEQKPSNADVSQAISEEFVQRPLRDEAGKGKSQTKTANDIIERLVQDFVSSEVNLPNTDAASASQSGRDALIAALMMRQIVDAAAPKGSERSMPEFTPFQQDATLAAKELKNSDAAAGEGQATRQSKRMTKSNAMRTMERIESALKEAAKARDGKSISLRLDPPSLGTVRVDVSLRDGALHARLSADSAEVNNLIRSKAYELQRMLRRLGLAVDTVSVSVGGEGEEQYQSSNSSNSDTSGQQPDFDTLVDNTVQRSENIGILKGATPIEDHWVA